MATAVSAPRRTSRPSPGGAASAPQAQQVAALSVPFSPRARWLPERPTLSLLAPEDRSLVRLREVPGELFVNGISADDAKQGALGDCYFVSTLASIANMRPEMIRQMVRQVGPNTYDVRFFDRETGLPVYQRVTGSLPTRRSDGSVVFGHSPDARELWPAIIEKALATRYGGYKNIESGSPGEALSEITGRTVNGRGIQASSAETIWQLMREATEKRWPMEANLTRAMVEKCGIATGGLPSNHAYSVLEAYEKNGQRWVVIREPNARFTYDGGYDVTVRDAAGKPRPGVSRLKLEDFLRCFRWVGAITDTPLPVNVAAAKPKPFVPRQPGVPVTAAQVQCAAPPKKPTPPPQRTWRQAVVDFFTKPWF